MKVRIESMRRALWAAATTGVAALLLAACGGDDGETTAAEGGEGGGGDVPQLTIGTQPWIGYGPMWIADDKGYDLDNGVDIKLVNFSTDQDLETGFASGKFQGVNYINNNLIRLADLGVDYRIVMMEDVSLEADGVVTCDPEIDSIDDVEGAKVAFEEFGGSEILFRHALDEAGIDFDSIDFVPIPAADAGTAAVAGKVDVAVTYEPYLQAALKEGQNCKVIYTSAEKPGLISDVLAITPELAEEQPDAVVAMIRAWDDAIQFYNENPKEGKAIIARHVGEKPAELAASFAGVELYDLEESQAYLEDDFEGLWNDIKAIMAEQEGQLKGDPQASDYLDTSFGEQALEDGEGG